MEVLTEQKKSITNSGSELILNRNKYVMTWKYSPGVWTTFLLCYTIQVLVVIIYLKLFVVLH